MSDFQAKPSQANGLSEDPTAYLREVSAFPNSAERTIDSENIEPAEQFLTDIIHLRPPLECEESKGCLRHLSRGIDWSEAAPADEKWYSQVEEKIRALQRADLSYDDELGGNGSPYEGPMDCLQTELEFQRKLDQKTGSGLPSLPKLESA